MNPTRGSELMDDAFAPPGESWVRVSTQLRSMRRTLAIGAAIVVGAGAAVAFGLTLGTVSAVVAVAVVLVCWAGVQLSIGRNYASWGYAERAEDLLVTRGVLFRRLVVVPYGRMQLVDVTAGPVERRFQIATVHLHTAAAGTDAKIRGLTATEAGRLRDRLASLGEARSAGL
jgi:membrane protein YdbS with pleckstrin-like domain